MSRQSCTSSSILKCKVQIQLNMHMLHRIFILILIIDRYCKIRSKLSDHGLNLLGKDIAKIFFPPHSIVLLYNPKQVERELPDLFFISTNLVSSAGEDHSQNIKGLPVHACTWHFPAPTIIRIYLTKLSELPKTHVSSELCHKYMSYAGSRQFMWTDRARSACTRVRETAWTGHTCSEIQSQPRDADKHTARG